MNLKRFSTYLVTGAICVSLLAGCSAGSQFSPPTAQQAGIGQPAGAAAPGAAHTMGVRPNEELPPNAWIINYLGWICYYYVSPTTGIWNFMYCITQNGTYVYSIATASNPYTYVTGMQSAQANFVGIVKKKNIVTSLTGLSGPATGVAMDKAGNVYATNAGSAVIDEFASGSTTPTASYTDTNLATASSLAVDKAGHLYVEGQSASSVGGIEVDMLVGSGFKPLAKPGSLGATAGGVAVQTVGKSDYVWINDQGSASGSPSITRYMLKGTELIKQGSFTYSGVNGGIAVDPKNTNRVYAVNNAASGSEYNITGVTYSYPSGAIISSSSPQTSTQQSVGIAIR